MRGLALLAAVTMLTGCSLTGGDGAPVASNELEGLVLQPGDVPRAFVRFDEGRQGMAERPPGGEGWKARYRRPGTAETEGPLVISSLVNRFGSEGDAKDQLAAQREDLAGGQLRWRSVEPPDVGDEALAMTVDQGSGRLRVRYVVVAWREANATASVEVNGFADKLEVADAVKLARRQAQRIERAAF
jgi:hypothetical protein